MLAMSIHQTWLFCTQTKMLTAIGFSLLLAASAQAQATAACGNSTTDNLTVKTRTGTFTGNLNDTYSDVRQFLYVPYAKVIPSASHTDKSNTVSRRLENEDGHLPKLSTPPPSQSIRPSTALLAPSTSQPFPQSGH